MQTLDPSFVSIALPALAALVWLIRLEGRVNTSESRFNDLKTDVEYIRNRIDQALDQ